MNFIIHLINLSSGIRGLIIFLKDLPPFKTKYQTADAVNLTITYLSI